MSVFIMGDLELAIRDRTYREPEDAHVAIIRGGDLQAGLQHLERRPDCTGLAVIGGSLDATELSPLAGRRVLAVSDNGPGLRSFVSRALQVTEEVEWLETRSLPQDPIAEWALPVAGLVLAAGSGSRMGANKLLLDFAGMPLVMHAVEAAREGGCHQVLAIYREEAVARALEGKVKLVPNPDADLGMSSSIRAGLLRVAASAQGILVLLGDQPLVGARTVAMLLKAWRREGAPPAVAASYDGSTWRPPVLVHRWLWPHLQSLEGDEGARSLFAAHPNWLETVPVSGSSEDIDTPEDYARVLKLPRR